MNDPYLYLLQPSSNIRDSRAAVQLLKELYAAEHRATRPHGIPGLLYATNRPIEDSHQQELNVIPFE